MLDKLACWTVPLHAVCARYAHPGGSCFDIWSHIPKRPYIPVKTRVWDLNMRELYALHVWFEPSSPTLASYILRNEYLRDVK